MKLPVGYVAGVGEHKPTGGYGGFGQKLLERMGWAKGQGLGKNKHGIKDAIDVRKKEDTLGVGASESNWKWDWKYWEDAYNSAARTVHHPNSSGGTSSSSSGSDSDSSSSSSSGSDSDSSESSDDDEPALAAIVAAANMHRDGTACTASQAELELAKQLAKDRRDIKGREGKLARIRQQEEAQAAAARAKMGLETPACTGSGKQTAGEAGLSKRDGGSSSGGEKAAKRSKTCKSSDQPAAAAAASDADADRGGSKKGKKRKGAGSDAQAGSSSSAGKSSREGFQQPAAAAPAAAEGGSGRSKVRKVVIVACEKQMQAAPFVPTPKEGWWGAKLFASAGLLEGLEEAKQHVQQQRQTFTEATQEGLYNATHEAQRKGRRGLGKSSTLKIAGGAWEGKKVTFGEEGAAEEEQEGQQQEEQQGAAPEELEQQQQQQLKKRKGKKRIVRITEGSESSAQDGAAAAAAAEAGGEQPGKQVKWAKLACKHLKGLPGGALKWKKLWAAVWEQAQQQQLGDSSSSGACKAECLRQLEKSKKLVVKGKVIALA